MAADVSEAMVRDLYAQRARPGAILVTIEADGLDDAIRVTNWPEGLEVNGVPYLFAPFTASWTGASREVPSGKAKIEIGVSGEAVEMIRLATGRPSALIERVRVAAPGVAEKAIRGARVAAAEVGLESISLTLSGRDYASELACHARYSQYRTPGLY